MSMVLLCRNQEPQNAAELGLGDQGSRAGIPENRGFHFLLLLYLTMCPGGCPSQSRNPRKDLCCRLSVQMSSTAPTADRFAGGTSSTSASRTWAGW